LKFIKKILAEKKIEVQFVIDKLTKSDEFDVIHQGIQRSGTNYLNILLKEKGYFVRNRHDPKRTNPAHKHFRWQKDKTTIFLDPSYKNTQYTQNIRDLNNICGFPESCKHIVLYKNPYSWLPSIERWARVNKWESYLTTPRNEWLTRAFLEWDAYYSAWEDIYKVSTSSVLLINFESLKNNQPNVLNGVDQFMGKLQINSEEITVNRVPKSPSGVTHNDEENIAFFKAFCVNGKFKWESYI